MNDGDKAATKTVVASLLSSGALNELIAKIIADAFTRANENFRS